MYFSDQPVLRDFDKFITYLCDHPSLPLTKDKVVLKGGDLIVLNEQMTSFTSQYVTARNPQRHYTLINSFYFIAQVADLFRVHTNTKNGNKTLVVNEERIRSYDALSDDEKYFFLMEAFWCHMDWEAAFDERSFWSIDRFIVLLNKGVGLKTRIIDRDAKRNGDVIVPHNFFVLEMFKAFGFMNLTWDDKLTTRPNTYICPYKDFTLLPLGGIMLTILLKERTPNYWHRDGDFNSFNIPDIDEEFEMDEDEEIAKGNFEDAFLPHLEGVKIETRLLSSSLNVVGERAFIGGCYYLKVSLDKDLYRTIAIGGSDTMEDLHYAIQNAFDLDDDHLYAFFMDNKAWSRNGESYWSPMNDEGYMADEIKIGFTGLYEGKSFLYLFDFGDEWRFNITVLSIKIDEKEPKEAKIIESVGESPLQYGSSDDDDEDWADED